MLPLAFPTLLTSDTIRRYTRTFFAAFGNSGSVFMKRLLLFLWFCLLTLSPALAQDNLTDDIPYIYYYSTPLNGIVIERADGSDSRIIGQGLVDDPYLYRVYGPGWSPDSEWFAWWVADPLNYYPEAGQGYAVSSDGQNRLQMLDSFACVVSMKWHPTHPLLLVGGFLEKDVDGMCPQATSSSRLFSYWLFDLDTQNRVAVFNTFNENLIFLNWLPDGNIQLIENVLLRDDSDERHISTGYNRRMGFVTISTDGTVVTRPISGEEANQFRKDLPPFYFNNPLYSITINPDISFGFHASFDGRVWPTNGIWTYDSFMHYPDLSRRWFLLGYGNGPVILYDPKTDLTRELSNCGIFAPCVDWLPEYVNLENLPPGREQSVVSSPQSIRYSEYIPRQERPALGIEDSPHDLVCDPFSRLSLVRNQLAGTIDFVLPAPIPGSCYRGSRYAGRISEYKVYPIEFAISPDHRYYAITGLQGAFEYTSLYNAVTGERITTLNFTGINLHFSDDSRTLITTGRFAEATWDIETLIDESLIYPSNETP